MTASTRLKLNVTASVPPKPLIPELPLGALKESGPEVPSKIGSPGFKVEFLPPMLGIVEHSPCDPARTTSNPQRRQIPSKYSVLARPTPRSSVPHFSTTRYRKRVLGNFINAQVARGREIANVCAAGTPIVQVRYCRIEFRKPLDCG